MATPNLLKIILDHLKAQAPLVSAASDGIYHSEFPGTIVSPPSLVVFQRIGGLDNPSYKRMNRSDHPREVACQFKFFGPGPDEADSLFRTFDDYLDGLGNVVHGTNTIRSCDRVGGPQPIIDTDLAEIDGGEWHYILAFYDLEIF